MKKGNKLLAVFLAAAMLFTGIAWDFGDTSVAEASETASAITAEEDSLDISFDNILVTELDAAGYTSTRFQSSAAVAGEVNRKVSEHWFSGEEAETPYGSADTGKNPGLKSNDISASLNRTVMYTPCSYEDFTVSAAIYYGAYSGIVIGEKNVYPTDSTSSSVAVFFNNGRIHIMGAVDRSTATIMRGSSAAVADNGSADGYKIFNNGSADTIKNKAGTVYTLNVKKTGDYLIIWISGGTGLMTIKLTDSYKTGAIGIQSRAYDGDNGGFQSVSIKKVHATETHDLDNADITELDDLGYSASFGATVKNNSVGNAFFSGMSNAAGTLTSANNGLSGTTTGTSVSGLNIPYVYQNFRLEAEVYHGQLVGAAVGDAASYPRSADKKMLSVFYNIYNNKVMLQMEGADTGSWTRVGGAALTTNANQWSPTSDGNTLAGTKEVVYTLVLEVRDGVATVWMEGYDGYVTATVSDTYVTGKISLIARHASNDGGGIKSYTITNLDAGDTQNFDNAALSNLEASGHTASISTAPGTTKKVSEVWFSGDSKYYSATEANKNVGLKPMNTDTNREMLNTPHVYENFRLEAEIYYGQVVGVIIGKNGVAPTINSGTDNGAVAIYINGSYLALTGSMDYTTVNFGGATKQTSKSGFIQYTPTGNSAGWNTARTLIIEVQDGVLSVFFKDLDNVLKVKLTENYKTENIALFARRYDTASGNAGGGLKSYTIEKLPSANTGTTADIAGYTDFDHVDTKALDAKGFTSTRFDNSNSYALDGTAEQSVGNHWFAGNGSIPSYTDTSKVTAANIGLKSNHTTADNTTADNTTTLLNTPYTYEAFRISTEVYWGANTGIVLGEKNVFPTSAVDSSVRIYFNGDQIQLVGGGLDYSTAEVTGGASWNTSYAPTYIFKPASDFTHVKGSVYKLNAEMMNGVLTVWVDGYDGVLTIKTSDTFKNERVALVSRGYDGDSGGFKSLTVEELDIISIAYTAEEFAGYRQETGYTVPSYKNYLFAGWFTDEACTAENAVGVDVTAVEQTVYAKFVPKYILTMQAQISSNLVDTDTTNDASGSIRFVTTVDTLDYSKVGFDIAYTVNGTEKNVTSASNTVYKKLYAVGSAEGETLTYEPGIFCKASNFFKACTVTDIPKDYYDVEFTVTPFWTTLDGTKVAGETAVKTVNQGILAASAGKVVYVSDNGTDSPGYGTSAYPFKTLNYALEQVSDGGTVYITDTLTITDNNSWSAHNKTVTISGAGESSSATLDFSGIGATNADAYLSINDAVTFRNLAVVFPGHVFAEGNAVTIASDVTVSAKALGEEKLPVIYGGGSTSTGAVARTELNLYAGSYAAIYGGGNSQKVTGDTHVTVGAGVNPDVDGMDHDSTKYLLFGGGRAGTVAGNTYVTVEDGGRFNYVYGGGRIAGSEVKGTTNVDFAGIAFSIYGGSEAGTNADTHVVMRSGQVYQIFGGCFASSMTGNTDVQILGGEVLRRVYGGCYNDLYGDGVKDSSVTGYTSVTIGPNASMSLDKELYDNALCAISRGGSFEGEWGAFILNEQVYASLSAAKKISENINVTKPLYHYLVTTNGNTADGAYGQVYAAGGGICIKPADGYTATVKDGSGTELTMTENADGTYTYTFPELNNSEAAMTITVTFGQSAL